MVCYLQPEMLTLILKLKRQRVQFFALRFRAVQFQLCSLETSGILNPVDWQFLVEIFEDYNTKCATFLVLFITVFP